MNERFVAAWFVMTLLLAGCDNPCEELADHVENCYVFVYQDPDQKALIIHQLRTRECEGDYRECRECLLDSLNDDCSNFEGLCGPECVGDID